MQRERLSKSEKAIMMIMWESGTNLLQSQILMKYNEQSKVKWKRQTLNTFFERIEEKGYLMRSLVDGRNNLCIPLISKKEYLKEELEQLAEEFRVSKEYLKSLL